MALRKKKASGEELKSLEEEEWRRTKLQDINYIIGFLHTFAAYLTHISNGSPKKIFLYFEKNVHRAVDPECLPLNDWSNICTIGRDESVTSDVETNQQVLFFNPTQQKTINFIYFLSDPIMGTITNELSNYGDRFLVSLSFIIDHLYKHHNRSFSWRNVEQIPDLLKMSKAPELRDSIMTVLEYLSQIHISPILIGLSEYKFHKSIDEEISLMSKMSDEASAIFNFTLDESLSVLQYNMRLLNYYRNLDKDDQFIGGTERKRQYLPIIGRIHSNLGDLHFWDEDYYAAALQYRSAINAFEKEDDQGGFMSKVRCMLKLGLAYESRHLYPNAYQIYCSLITILIEKRWIQEDIYGLSTIATFAEGWRPKRQIMIHRNKMPHPTLYEEEFIQTESPEETSLNPITYATDVDGTISSFARDLTKTKAELVNRLSLFEEVRYVYQAILAKLSVLEKMGMSGITQTNIDVAESEFRMIYKTVNIKEKFIISADFFRKLAEILYYKNSLTILTQNQESFYASVNYGDYDLLAHLDDFCAYKSSSNPIIIKHDVEFFFNGLYTVTSSNEDAPMFNYDDLKEQSQSSFTEVFKYLEKRLPVYMSKFKRLPLDIQPVDLDIQPVDGENDNEEKKEKILQLVRNRIESNVKEFLLYNVNVVTTNQSERFPFSTLDYCDLHRKMMRESKLRPACYACKYYTRSLRIIVDNMFEEKLGVLLDEKVSQLSKSLGVLQKSFKKYLIYTNTNHIRTLAQTLDGFGNIMLSCAAGDAFEGKVYKTEKGISSGVIRMLRDLSECMSEKDEEKKIKTFLEGFDAEKAKRGEKEDDKEGAGTKTKRLTRLDKSILYYWDAYRFYLIDACYNEAVVILNKIISLLVHYIEVVGYFHRTDGLGWKDETETIQTIILGDPETGKKPFISVLFQLVVRHTGYKYDHTNLTEINELKWIFSKRMRDDIDLTRLSLYPDIRAAWLRVIEIRARGLKLLKDLQPDFNQTMYAKFISDVYPLIAPKRRYETTFYEEVLGYYTKMRFNEHILSNLVQGNGILNESHSDYSGTYHLSFFQKLGDYLSSKDEQERLDNLLFRSTGKEDRLQIVEYLIHDSLICITNIVKVFTPHSHLTSYPKSFVGFVYNYFWEWSRKYEFLYYLYQYKECQKPDGGLCEEQERIVTSFLQRMRVPDSDRYREPLKNAMDNCINYIPDNKESERKYGPRSVRFYERIRNDTDDIAMNTIFSNYAAEMALNYYQMAEEANTEGDAYKEMIGTLQFLHDDLNNDTCQFNIACERFLLNCGIIAAQRGKLEKLYKDSSIYQLDRAYINTPRQVQEGQVVEPGQFDNARFINSKY